MGDLFDAWREHKKDRRAERLDEASQDDSDFTKLSPLHWRTFVGPERLDYWPTTGRWSWKGNTYRGGHRAMRAFLSRKRIDAEKKPRRAGTSS